MHRSVKAALPTASGSLARVLVAFVDIRGFSLFLREVEAAEAAAYLRCLYQKLLDDYFIDSTYFKLTGDGMMIISEYPEFPTEVLREKANQMVAAALRLMDEFPQLCSDDPNVYFDARPLGLGVGIARGSAYRLDSDGSILDYSGRPLNLAARLMELARPMGIVLEHSVAVNLTDDFAKRFTLNNAYVRGGFEERPIKVHCLAGSTRIPSDNLRPLDKPKWQRTVVQNTYGEWQTTPTRFRIPLPSAPKKPKEISVLVRYPRRTKSGGKSKTTIRGTEVTDFAHIAVGTEHFVEIGMRTLVTYLASQRLTKKWPVAIQVDYED